MRYDLKGSILPEIVVLCGSTRFYDWFQQANYTLTMQGKIVLSVGWAKERDVPITPAQKKMLDELHKRKIDLADSVLILNIGGYIGESTLSEIEYAEKMDKPVTYIEGPPIP